MPPVLATTARTRTMPPAAHMFMPSPLRRRVRFLIWLRRTHAWLGLWGAALALLFGATGFLLNHRAVLKIPAAKLAQSVIQVPLAKPPESPDVLAAELRHALAIEKPPVIVKVEPAQSVVWGGRTIAQPELWRVFFATPQRTLDAQYWAGNAFVTVKRQDANLFAMLTRLHTGAGANAAWVLLVDTLAGGLIVLALSGILLWSRLHGSRLTGAGIALTSLGLAGWFAWQLL